MKRLRKAEVVGNQWFAYHGTSADNLDDILKNGIKPQGSSEYVYLAPNEDLAWYFAGVRNNPVVIKVKLDPSQDLNQILRNNIEYPYDNFEEEYYRKTIAPKYDIDSNLSVEAIQERLDDLEIDIGDIEDEIMKAYFNSAELMLSYIPVNRIIEVLR